MSDNELLLAISNMMEPIRHDIQGVKDEIREMKADICELKHDMQDVKTRLTHVELVLDNDISPRLQNIEACYTSTYERYRESTDEHDQMKQDITLLKKVVSEHSEKLRKIS